MRRGYIALVIVLVVVGGRNGEGVDGVLMGAVGQRRRGGGRQRCQNRRRGGQPAGVRRGGRGARLRARRGDVEVPQLVHVLVVQRRRRRLMGVQVGDGSVIGHRRRRKRVQRRVRLGGAVAPRR